MTNSGVEGRDTVWDNLCKCLEAPEPLDVDKILRLCRKASNLPPIDSPVDFSRDVGSFSQRSLPFDSEEFKTWWSKAQASSLVVIRDGLGAKEWQYFMNILSHADVSHIEHLVLKFHNTLRDTKLAWDQLGIALSGRDFSKLKTLIVLTTRRYGTIFDQVSSKSLAECIGGTLRNLRTLSIEFMDTDNLLDALSDARLSQLTAIALKLNVLRDICTLERTFKSGCLKSLQRLSLWRLPEEADQFWEVFIKAIKSGNLPRLRHLHIINGDLGSDVLKDLLRKCEEWFTSLETLVFKNCGINSKHLWSMVTAVIVEVPNVKLALRRLDFESNRLDSKAIDALVSLAHSEEYSSRLEHLEALDLMGNTSDSMSKALVSFIDSITMGSWPSLQKLRWPTLYLKKLDANTVVQDYYANQYLTTELIGDSSDGYDGSWKPKLNTYWSRNVRLAGLREKLGEELGDNLGDFVQLTFGKVFLCGFPEVGKTTLRRTLLRYFGNRTKFVWETRPIKEPRTRGIEIRKIEENIGGEKTTLVVWDLAGQDEYHVLHGTFLTDLGFVSGKATTFILVFRACFQSDVKEKLWYWLRFVATSSRGLVKRHVVVVLNRFNGILCTGDDLRLWQALIESFAKKFDNLLDIHLDPFVIDVRKAAPIQPLKNHLFDYARASLRDVQVPRICFEFCEELKQWSESENRNHLPILTWQAFEERWKLSVRGNHFNVRTLKYAATFLHEIGEIIFFEEKKLKNPSCGHRSILVPNPEWFCRKVVGELLLPEKMLEGRGPVKVSESGAIRVIDFQAFFKHLLVRGTQSDDIISMLELLGLCYRKVEEEKGEEEIIVPALIRKDDYSSIDWEDRGFHGVMGRCLAANDTNKNIIPVILFRRLQVELAQDKDFGGRGDSEFRVGKSFVNLKVGHLLVLIQFDVDHSDPIDDRIDILIKSATRGDPAIVRSGQVECICEIMQKLQDLCAICCDGLTYDIKVIQPSTAADRANKMSERKFMSLQEIKDLVIKGKKYLAWQVGGNNMEPEWFLSKEELDRLVGTVQRVYDECREDAVTMGLLAEDFSDEIEALEEERDNNAFTGDHSSHGDDQDGLTPKIFHEGMQKLEAVVRREGRHIRQHIDRNTKELLLEVRRGHELLVKQIQEQQSFSIEEKHSSVPRYIFLTKSEDQTWIRLSEAFRSTYQLHLLCEAHFDDGFLHEVKGQEGIELTRSKEWLLKVSPWLRRSLQVAIMVGKTVGNVYLPGVFNLIPDVNVPNSSDVLATAVDKAATVLLEDDGEIQSQDERGKRGTATHPINVKEKLIAQEVVKDLISELGYIVFAQKIGLKKVLLRATAQPHASSSKQAQPSVLWICNHCYKKYGDRTTDI